MAIWAALGFCFVMFLCMVVIPRASFIVCISMLATQWGLLNFPPKESTGDVYVDSFSAISLLFVVSGVLWGLIWDIGNVIKVLRRDF